MLKRRSFWLILILILVPLLQACTQEAEQEASPTATSQPLATGTTPDAALDEIDQEQGYPAPELDGKPGEAYPEPADGDFIDTTNRPELPDVNPTPEESTGVVSGVVLLDTTGVAPPEAVVYLGGIVTTDTGIRVVRLDRTEAPAAIPAADGRFVFPTVEPGEYGMILSHPDISFVVDDPETGRSLIFTVVPGQSIELEEVTISLP